MPSLCKNGHFPVYCVLWYSAGVMPVIRLKNFEKKEGLGKFSSSDIWNINRLLCFSNTFASRITDWLIHCITVCPLASRITVLR